MKIINRIKCFFGFHRWGLIFGLDPGQGSGLETMTTKYCIHCPFVHSIIHKPAEIKGQEIDPDLVFWDECGDISDEALKYLKRRGNWEDLKKRVAKGEVKIPTGKQNEN